MFDRKDFIFQSLTESSKVKLLVLEKCYEPIMKAADILVEAVRSGKKIMLAGNGGSAADSQHIATEFMIRLSHDLSRPAIAAIALTTDSSNITAGGNDIGFENVIARSIEGLGNEDDVFICISTSGNSPNIIKAVEKAHEKSISVVGFLGGKGGKLAEMCDVPIIVPSENTQRIQESHITIGHILCEIVERELYGS
ncbi:MAG: SIS domain-containing protein [Ignavibacteria bacterium]|jgi:D-sedoheptulose 7-phosphate isomerase|nr:SIS domain-containing protein [Ignavibacteria bacterium]